MILLLGSRGGLRKVKIALRSGGKRFRDIAHAGRGRSG
jgi:hypothetical protein